MQPASSTPIPDGLLAAMTLLSENPCLGLKSNNPALHPGHNLPNFTAAIGDSWGVASETRWSHEMGRFMSPDYSGDGGTDPEPVPWADYTNPQSLNLYSYVQNNPLTNVDPDGHDCIYATGVGSGYQVVSGDCLSPNDSGIFVNGTVTSANFNASNNSIGYSYTNDDTGSLGTGVIANVPTPQPMDQGAITDNSGSLLMGIAGGMATDYVVGRVLGGVFGKSAGEAASSAASQSPKLVIRAQQLTHAMRVEAGHNTPLGTPTQIKAAIEAALKAGQYTVSPGGVVTGNATIQGVVHEFTGFLQGNQVIFSNIYRQ
jgi:RHS repeat-associated protein